MRAAVVHDFEEPLRIEELPKPEPGAGEILVKIEASGLCHTDIHAAHRDWPVKPKLPLIPGHEGVGIVESVGSGVTEVEEGERVAIPWLGYACGACEYCASGWETLCEHQLNTGYVIDGSYTEYAKGFAKYVGRVPEGVSALEAAPLTCAGVTTYKAIKVSGTRPSDLVAVFGIGGTWPCSTPGSRRRDQEARRRRRGHSYSRLPAGFRAGLRLLEAGWDARFRGAAGG